VKGTPQITRAGVAGLVVAALAVSGPAALAEQSKFHVRPTLKLNRKAEQDTLRGKVKSKEHACEANRRVKLKHRNVTQEKGSQVMARLRTNGKGKVKYRPKRNQNGDRYLTPGYYTLKVGQKQVSTGSGAVTCRSRNSSSLFVG
jgi:hypothetical protein